MKSGFIISVLFLLASWIAIKEVNKKYSVSLTQEQWQHNINTLETVKRVMGKSTLPANVVNDWTDSVTAVEQEFINQIQKQIAADTVKSKK